ncbi:MAG: tRNA isopentenyl-2-thiomethyl-A-37 hydroxylase MiaE [Planctomycetota bacterium]
MFQLAETDHAPWLEKVLPHLDELLIEQAHLEKKAASAALHLIFRYPEHLFMHRELSELAREELEHFELALELCGRRGIEVRKLEPSGYAKGLAEAIREAEPEKLCDKLLVAALIEARSCQRMKVLGEALADQDAELSGFYLGLVQSEARHHGSYRRFAVEIFGEELIEARIHALRSHEGEVVRRPDPLPRLHS